MKLEEIVEKHYDRHWWWGLDGYEIKEALLELAKEVQSSASEPTEDRHDES